MQMKNGLKDKAAIVGIGQTEFSKRSGRTELKLAIEAIGAALDDCGLSPQDVDGICIYTAENNPENDVIHNLGGGDLRFFSRIHYGGGAACAPIHQAAMAVASGAAEVVVCYRAMNERSEQRFGTGVQDRQNAPTAESVHYGWY